MPQAATKAIAAAQAGQAESAAELERFKERSDAIQRRVAATGSVLQQVPACLMPRQLPSVLRAALKRAATA